jgi:RNA polymerase primary sigma factor
LQEKQDNLKLFFDHLKHLGSSNRKITNSQLNLAIEGLKLTRPQALDAVAFAESNGYTIVHDEKLHLPQAENAVISWEDIDIDVDDDWDNDLDAEIESEEFRKAVEDADYHYTFEDNQLLLENIQSLDSEEAFEQRVEFIDKLVQANEHLVMTEANKYSGYVTGSYSFEDIMQTGRMGLLEAAERFDITSGNQFSTYAYHWIKQHIIRGIQNNSKLVRLPANVWEKLSKLNREETQLTTELGRTPQDEELALRLNFTAEKVKELKGVRHMNQMTIGLDTSVGTDNDSDMKLGDILPDDKFESPEEYVERLERGKTVRASMVNRLTERERLVLTMRFGLNDGIELTLEDIGRMMNLTKERVRQIQKKSLEKMKKFAVKDLNTFIPDDQRGEEFGLTA